MNAPFAMTSETNKIIRVLSGRHAGAEHRLHSGKFIRIGHSFDHDVVLRSKQTSGVSLELHLLDNIATLKVVAGSVDLLGRAVGAGETAHLPFFLPVSLGEFSFAIGDAASDRWEEAQSLQKRIAETSADLDTQTEAHAAIPAMTEQASAVERLTTRLSPVRVWAEKPRDWPRIGIIAAAGLLIAVAAGPLWRTANDQINGPEQQQSTLAAMGFQGLKVSRDEVSGQTVVAGTLRTDAELAKVRQYVGEKIPDGRVDVETSEGHAAAAKEILTAQGIEANVKAPAIGALQIQSEYMPKDKQDQIAQLLKKDLSAVKNISFTVNNTMGERDLQYFFASTSYGLATYVYSGPGGRSYIKTADGTSWWSGSELPTGHVIKSMEQGKIIFEREGRVEELVM